MKGKDIYNNILEYADDKGNHYLNDVEFIRKNDLEFFIKEFNNGLSEYENDDYLSKKHLIDFVDISLSTIVKKCNLNIEG